MNIVIDPELKSLMVPLSEGEYTQLEENLREWGCRDKLTVWAASNGNGNTHLTLLDGHNRYEICHKYDIPFGYEEIELESRDAAVDWIIKHQLSRLNLTPEQTSYYRGLQYEREKVREKFKGNQHTGGHQNDVHQKTADKLAQQHKVSKPTIERDAQFARAIASLSEKCGHDIINLVLNRETKLSRQDVSRLAYVAQHNVAYAIDTLDLVLNAETPKEASEAVATAYKATKEQLQREQEAAGVEIKQSKDNRVVAPSNNYTDSDDAQNPSPVEQPELVLTPPETHDRDEEIVLEDGRKLYVLHRPHSKPVFNTTNESVDWAQWTWNPVTGCWHGCNYCYAREIANSDRMAASYPYKFEPTFHPARLAAPKNTPFPKDTSDLRSKNVFTCSMADLFGKWVPDQWIMRVFAAVASAPEWNFLFLTKFPQRLQEICDALGGFPDNAWVGTTVDTQARVRVAEKAFQKISAKVKWLSCEPLLEKLTFESLDMFDWVVLGGQSASYFNGTPEFQPEWEWVEHLWVQARAAKCDVYWKENLTVRPKECPW